MRIGELSEKSGRTQRTLHFYEELGLLTPVGRTAGGFRLYDAESLLRIHWISRLQEVGFSLPEIKDFLVELKRRQSGPAMMDELRAFYAQKLDEARTRLAQLRALEKELQDSLDYLAGCRTCAPSTEKHACPSCAVDEHVDKSAPPMVAAVYEPTPELHR
jgi:MerR family copper efflux transcriptional regulator